MTLLPRSILHLSGIANLASPSSSSQTLELWTQLASQLSGGRAEASHDLASLNIQALRDRLGSQAEAFLALRQESSYDIFSNSLLQIARHLEAAGDVDSAALCFQSLAQTGSISAEARDHLEVLQGRGSLGLRLESLSREVALRAIDPVGLAGMFGAGLAFRGTRLLTLARLAEAPVVPRLARLLSPTLLANLAGFAVEVPTFTATTRLASLALGRNQVWSPSALAQELAGGAIFLGSLKIFGGLFSPASSATLSELGTFLGILSAQQLETWAQLRPEQDTSHLLTEALGTWIQCHASGRMLHAITPEGYRRLEQDLELRSRRLTLEMPANLLASSMSLTRFARRFQPTLHEIRDTLHAALLAPLWLAMGAGGLGGGGRTLRIATFRRAQWLMDQLNLEPSDPGRIARSLEEVFPHLRREERSEILHRSLALIDLGWNSALASKQALSQLLPALTPRECLSLSQALYPRLTRMETYMRYEFEAVFWRAFDSLRAAQKTSFFRDIFEGEDWRSMSPAKIVPLLERIATFNSREIPNPALSELNELAAILPAAKREAVEYPERLPRYQHEILKELFTSPPVRRRLAKEEHCSLGTIVPIHYLDHDPEGGETSLDIFHSMRQRLIVRLFQGGWRPGQIPSQELLRSVLAAEGETRHLPLLSLENDWGISLLLDGHHRLAALASLVAEGLLPEIVLERIPVERNYTIHPSYFLDDALGSDFVTPGAFSWLQVLPFDASSQALLRRIGATVDLGQMFRMHRLPDLRPGEGILASIAGGIGVYSLLSPETAHAAYQLSQHASSASHPFALGIATLLGLGGIAMAVAPRRPRQSGIHERPTRILESHRSSTVEMRVTDEAPVAPLGHFENVFNPRETFPIPKPMPGQELILGRATTQESNIFPAQFRQIGRRQLEIREREGQVEIRPHRGSRGLRINHHNLDPLQWYVLNDGDWVELVSEARQDLQITSKDEGEIRSHRPLEDALRLGTTPSEMEQAAIFRFRRAPEPRSSEVTESVPPLGQGPGLLDNLWTSIKDLFLGAQRPPARKPDIAPTSPAPPPRASIQDPRSLDREIVQLSGQVKSVVNLFEQSLNHAEENHGSADVLKSLLTVHRRFCGLSERVQPLSYQTVEGHRVSLSGFKVPYWDGVFAHRLHNYEDALGRFQLEGAEATAVGALRDQLNVTRDRLTRLLEVVRQHRRFFQKPEELVMFDAMERAYHGLNPPIASEARRIVSAARDLDTTVDPGARQKWIQDFMLQIPPYQAVLNVRILMGELKQSREHRIFGDFYQALSYGSAHQGLRPVRALYEPESGELLAFLTDRSQLDPLLRQMGTTPDQVQEIIFWVDAQRSGRILEISGVNPEHPEPVRYSVEWLRGLQVLPARTSEPPPPALPEIQAWTHFAEGPETQAWRIFPQPPEGGEASSLRNIVGLTPLASSLQADGRPFWTLVTLEGLSPRPEDFLQLWVTQEQIGHLSVGQRVAILPNLPR